MREGGVLGKIGRALGFVAAEAEAEKDARLTARKKELEVVQEQRRRYLQRSRRVMERREP